MKIDVNLPEGIDIADAAAEAERVGFAAGWVAELGHDSLISLATATPRTSRMSLGTGIAVAFARSPMVMAVAANDVHVASNGRLLLGLGSQVRAHITNRFSMPWSAPAARMREYIAALHAIWASWNDGVPLKFRGDFYTHTLMTPAFSPAPNPYGPPKVFLAAVGELMTEVAGEVADGMICHGFTTERYVREVTLPALQRGRERSGRSDAAVELTVLPMIVTGSDEAQFAASRAASQQRIAFYGSTPAYRSVLELHGWGDLQTELWTLSKQGRWDEMGALIDDDVLATFAVIADPDQLAAQLTARYGDIADRLVLLGDRDALAAMAPAAATLMRAG
jgi:probable F420-dependent oxidoreductase